ncbi:hypothetical protein OEZ85_010798 [Tetradesmus obliquus]|uniref:Uncharacterized protein n=1 Tax=Tetradesmus obliquus TaxID=3088 RepID=A0ABY8TNC8_TETOB|nr:hypothetical protein OEZ85_010798 [Tetradesmus obliquus]
MEHRTVLQHRTCRCWHQQRQCFRPAAKQRRLAQAAAAAAEQQQQPAYPYNSGDSRQQKATIEHIFKPDADGSSSSSASTIQAPWNVSWQMSERNIMWSDDLKLRLIKRIASQELQVSEDELEDRLQQLYNLLPDLASRLVKAPPKRVAQLAASTEIIAERLLRLRDIFPQANTSNMVNNRLTLLLDDDLDAVAAAAVRLRQLLPQIHVDRFVEGFPLVLDVDDFELALEDAKRIMPGMDITQMLRSNPDMILSLQKGKNLIPYDQIDNPWS